MACIKGWVSLLAVFHLVGVAVHGADAAPIAFLSHATPAFPGPLPSLLSTLRRLLERAGWPIEHTTGRFSLQWQMIARALGLPRETVYFWKRGALRSFNDSWQKEIETCVVLLAVITLQRTCWNRRQLSNSDAEGSL